MPDRNCRVHPARQRGGGWPARPGSAPRALTQYTRRVSARPCGPVSWPRPAGRAGRWPGRTGLDAGNAQGAAHAIPVSDLRTARAAAGNPWQVPWCGTGKRLPFRRRPGESRKLWHDASRSGADDYPAVFIPELW